jgi:PAS domain S-box-containing protein
LTRRRTARTAGRARRTTDRPDARTKRRKVAPRPAAARGSTNAPGGAADVPALVAELQTQQVELQAQNDTLREAQRSLEESRDQFAELFDFAPIAYVTLDGNAVIRQLNFAATAMFGLTREAAIGMPFVAFVRIEHQPRFYDHMSRCERGSQKLTTELDVRVGSRTQGGPTFTPVQIITAPNPGTSNIAEYRTAILNLTDRRRADQREAELIREAALREQAERSNEARDEFFSLLAHELRTPLNAVHGWTHLLASGDLSEGETRRAIEVIARNVQVQIGLIDEMLDQSRIVRGALELRKASLDLAGLVAAAVDAVRPIAAEKGLQLDAHIDPLAAHVVGDEERLTQVLSNLLTNAIKFTPPGGQIMVRLDRGVFTTPGLAPQTKDHWRECARLSISDTGQGMTAEELERVFDRFWRGKTSTTSVGGLGLGLAIVHRLVEMHGGTVRAESEGPGMGSTFVVELPIEWEHLPVSRLRPPPVKATRKLGDVRILLVDDDPEARDIVRRVLEPLGADVTTVATPHEAYEAIQRIKPDLFVSDLAMPEEDGLSLIRRIRALPSERGGVTPAVALTAWAGAGDESRVLQAGFQTFVAKPVDPERLSELIGELCSTPSGDGHR